MRLISVKDFRDRSVPDVDSLEEINPTGLNTNEALLRYNDIVFVRSNGNKNLIGRSMRIDDDYEDLAFSAFCIRFRTNSSEADPRFLAHYFRSPLFRSELSSLGKGTNISNLSQPLMRAVRCPLPEFAVQQRIAKVLSAYDDLIQNNQRRMELLETAARQLYREWFVRLRFPGYEHAHIVGGVPDGWCATSIRELVLNNEAEIQTGPFGTQLKAADYVPSGTAVINVRNIGLGSLRDERLEYVPEEVVDRLACHLLEEGDIVFGRKGAVDRHLLVTRLSRGFMQGSDCIRLRISPRRSLSALLSFAFREPSHKEWMIAQCSNKATMASLNQEVVGRISVLIPRWSILKEFDDMTSVLLRQRENLQAQNQKLRAARDLLLPRLMSGEIAV